MHFYEKIRFMIPKNEKKKNHEAATTTMLFGPYRMQKKREHGIGDGCQKDFATFMSKTVFFVSELPQIFKITFLVNKI